MDMSVLDCAFTHYTGRILNDKMTNRSLYLLGAERWS